MEAHALEARFESKESLCLGINLGPLFGVIVEAAHVESEFLLAAAVELADCIKHLLEGSFPFQDDEMGFGLLPEHVSARGVRDAVVVASVVPFLEFLHDCHFLSVLKSLFFRSFWLYYSREVD